MHLSPTLDRSHLNLALGVGVSLEDDCVSIRDVHQTFTAAFRMVSTNVLALIFIVFWEIFASCTHPKSPSPKPGTIKIGQSKCFAQKEGSFYIDAEDCDKEASDQKWVYDGTRIRSYQWVHYLIWKWSSVRSLNVFLYRDPSKCIWGRGHNQRLAIHTCLSVRHRIDDKRFNFRKHPDKPYMSLHTMHRRRVYLTSSHVLLSTQHDSRCHDGWDPGWSRIEVPNGFLTHVRTLFFVCRMV